MSIISSFWSHNRNFLGNAVKNISPVAAAFIPGIGPGLAALLAGGGSALGQGMEKGSNFGDIAKAGLTNAAIGAGGNSAVGALKGAFMPSSAGASFGAGTSAGGAGAAPASMTPHFPGFADAAAGGSAPGAGAAGGGGSFLGKAAGFVENHPTAISMGLNGLGNIASAASTNDLRNQEAEAMRRANATSDYELQQRKARDQALLPLYQMLAGRFKDIATQSPFSFTPYGNGS